MPDLNILKTAASTSLLALALVASPAASLASAAVARPALDKPMPEAGYDQQWQFRVMLDDKEIGEHSFRLARAGESELVDIQARFAVKFAFITAYEYDHSNTEQWQAGCLNRIDSKTDDNGKHFAIRGTAQAGGFAVQSNDQQQRLTAGCVNTFAYWRPSILGERQLLNSQTGEMQDVTVRFAGFGQVDYNGRKINSRQYVLTTEDSDINLWYTLDKQYWLALESPARGDRMIRYVPTLLPAGALQADANLKTLSQN
jgi:hypothetical protein